MRGIAGLVVIIAVLYFTGAGGQLWNNIRQLDSGCYTALERLGGTMASPICDGVARGIAYLDNGLVMLTQQFQSWKESTFGDMTNFDSMTASIGERLTRLASSNDTLTQMMKAGPGSLGGTRESLQNAIDSFTIGQGYLKQGGTSSEALQWFQRGAQQPQGYGLMSQLQLGNLYMTGQGVPQDNQMASAYLQQASNSITTLMGSNSPQSQQLLGSLPGSPQQVKLQLETAIQQLRLKK